ncbi:MAG: hypothetical protein ACI9H8_001584 [Lysobacterales bacterium]|jgi:uncharacterized protein YcgL (UPF0745 family)
MNCSVYRSDRKDYTYLYLLVGKTFEEIPPALQNAFGNPEFVIDLELSPQRKLASEDVNEVMQNLQDNGFHLQLPPGDQKGDLI